MKVMIGMSRRRQTSNSLRVLRLDALGRVDHHDRGVDGGEGAVGVLGKVLVARRVEQVEEQPACSKVMTEATTEMPRSRSMPIQSERVLRRFASARTSPASWIAPPNKQQLFGQRGLAGVRVGDDGEGAPARDGVGVESWSSGFFGGSAAST